MKEYILNLIQNIRISDFFDIAIISAFSYAVLVWFKKTASRFVLLGIIILGVIYTLARVFGMYLTEYFLQGFFAILLIAMIVIFQEDLRHFFERLATWGVLKKRRAKQALYEDIEPLTRAVAHLAVNRHGALIVLRKRDFLARHLEGGVALDGKLSAALLESIFDPHSIGHDGAVIIEDGRIVRFGVHLPLSSSGRHAKTLGLRHTAALGLAELTDALCIVVSEERGTVSIARDGTIKKLRELEQLTALLEGFYLERYPHAAQKSWMRRIGANPWEKGIALLMACTLWLIFGYQTENIRRDFITPIAYRNLPSDWIIEEQRPKEATVTLSGSDQSFGLLNKDTLKVVIDVSGVAEGRQKITLRREQVQHPSNLSVVGIRPSEIRLTAKKMLAFDIPVKIKTTGQLPKGLKLIHMEAIPPSVKIMALKGTANKSGISTETIDLASVNEDSRISVSLILPPAMQYIEKNGGNIEVLIDVESVEQDN